MPTPRKPTPPTTTAIDQFCAAFDDLFGRYEERQALRQYLIGLLLPREHNKTLVELAALVPGANQQALHQFLHNAPWDAEALNQRRLRQWQAHPWREPHAGGVLIVDETGDPKRGQRIVLAAQHYLGKLGHVANGVVAVTNHWADGSRHVPLGVKPYRPASRLPHGQNDPAFATKPQLAWQLIAEARGWHSLPLGGRRQRLRREFLVRSPDGDRADPVHYGPASVAWDLAVRRRPGPSPRLHPR